MPDILFERMPIPVAVCDLELRLRRWNPPFAEFLGRATGTDSAAVMAGAGLVALVPGAEAALAPLVERVRAGEMVRLDALRLERVDDVSHWDLTLAPLAVDGVVAGVIVHAAEATALALEQARLTEQERSAREEATRLAVEQRAAREAAARQLDRLTALTGITERLLAATAVESVLEIVVESASRLCEASGSLVSLIDADARHARLVAAHGLLAVTVARLRAEAPRALDGPFFAGSATDAALRQGTALAIEDYATWPASGARDASLADGVRSLIVAPLRVRGVPIGALSVTDPRPRAFAPEDVALVQALADQAALAIEQARLLDAAQASQAVATERAEELAALLEVAGALASTLELEPLLDRILDQLLLVIDYRSAGMFLARGDALETVAARDTRDRSRGRAPLGHRRPLAQVAGIWQPLLRGEPLLIGDLHRHDDPLVHAWRVATSSYGADPPSSVRAWLGMPLSVRGRVVGYLALTREEPDSFTARDTELAIAFAGHAAVAVENARLYAESRQLAALEERARLARDLHDSVTQSVFSAGMLAHTALVQHERGTAAVAETLVRVQTVLGDALAEMRALLFELQPTALAEEGLARALQKLAAAVQVRTDVPISYSGDSAHRLAPETETAIFRIAQEALANATKYARATAIQLTLSEAAGRLAVTVEDNGIGFDPSAAVKPSADGKRGGMGLRSMRERAVAAGLTVHVQSAPGKGTRVTVETPLSTTVAANR